jgi:hypothetical protein
MDRFGFSGLDIGMGEILALKSKGSSTPSPTRRQNNRRNSALPCAVPCRNLSRPDGRSRPASESQSQPRCLTRERNRRTGGWQTDLLHCRRFHIADQNSFRLARHPPMAQLHTRNIDLTDRGRLRLHENGRPWSLGKFRITVSWDALVAVEWGSSMKPRT